MDATTAIGGAGAPLQIRAPARPQGERGDFAAAIAAEAMAHLALEAPFRAPVPVTAETLPPAAQGYAAARAAVSGQ